MPELGAISATAQAIWSHPTWDIISILALIAGGFFYGIFAGKSRVAATIIYTYAAYALFLALPLGAWFKNFSEVEEFFAKTAVFTATFLLLAFSLGSRRSRGITPAGSWWKIFILCFLQAGLLIHIFLSFLPPGRFEILAPFTRTVFANPAYHIWWVIVPLAVIILFRRFESDT
ncbi:MAG: hypothetical protein HYT98_00965 [Candidatus Sungbacteria bacterium]|nr:hypothetical protein [Candidatus Sungbacteria bacterium]